MSSDLFGSVVVVILVIFLYLFIGRNIDKNKNYRKYYFMALGCIGVIFPLIVDKDSNYFIFLFIAVFVVIYFI